MPNLDIIYDVTTEVTWDERKTNKQVIYQTTSLPNFVTFDAFYFCLWPKTLSFEGYLEGKALATDHRVLGQKQNNVSAKPAGPVDQTVSVKPTGTVFKPKSPAQLAAKILNNL